MNNTQAKKSFPRVNWQVETNGHAAFHGEAAIHTVELIEGGERVNHRYSAIIKTELDEDVVPSAELLAAAQRLAVGANMHDDLVTTVRAMHRTYGRLQEIVSDCIQGGRLTEADLPDDFEALRDVLNACGRVEALAKTMLDMAGREPNAGDADMQARQGQVLATLMSVAFQRQLSTTINAAREHVNDVTSGIEDGTYLASENEDIDEKSTAVDALDGFYRGIRTITPDQSIADDTEEPGNDAPGL